LVKAKADNSVQEVQHPLDGPVLFGRGPDSAVPLNGTGISRDHLAFQLDNSDLVVTDLSSNGTWINGERIPKGRKHKVAAGDAVELPGYEIRFRIPGEAGAATPAAVEAAAAAAPEEKPAPRGLAAKARSAVGSLTRLERFLILVALASLGLLLFYVFQ
jgi:pSer/pThr/pTyr-binding forkhead associated (FHA) protein